MQKIAWGSSSDSMAGEHGAKSMSTGSKDTLPGVDSPSPATAEQRLKQLGIKLPTPPELFGIYAEAVQTGNLLFLTGMLPTAGRKAKFIGRIGAELDVQTGRQAAYLAALNGLAVASHQPSAYTQHDETSRYIKGADVVGEAIRERRIEHDRQPVDREEPSVVHLVSSRRLHPAVHRQDPE